MGGLISVMLCLISFMRLYSFFFCDGKVKSLEAYKDTQLKKECKENYPATIAQINADLDKIALHTHMPALDSENHLPKTTEDDNKEDNGGEIAEDDTDVLNGDP